MRFLLVILLFVSFCSFAQNNNDPVFALKPSLGINVCQIHGDAYNGYDKPGGFAGAAINAKINSRISIELGFYFSQKGARHNGNIDKGDFSYYRLNLNYIDIPVSFRYMLNTRYFVTAGPSLAYLVGYSENINYTDQTGLYPFKKLELGLNVGLGRKIKGNFSFELRCSNSIATVRSYGVVANLVFFPNPVARFFNKGFYNNILTFIFSYQLNFKRKSANIQS